MIVLFVFRIFTNFSSIFGYWAGCLVVKKEPLKFLALDILTV